MSNKIKGLVVTLEKDINEEDSEFIINTLKMIRGVASVNPVFTDISDQINRERVKSELRVKLFDFFQNELLK